MTRRRRAVITGIGIFCGAGKDIPSFTDSLINGKSAIAELELFDASRFHSRIGAEIRNYRASDYFAPSLARKLSRADQFAMIAAGEAVSDSALSNCRISSETGVCVGAGAAGMYQGEFWLKAQIEGKKASPGLLRGILPDSTATLLAKNFRFRGYQGTVTTACSSSSTAIGMAAEMISRGELKTVLAGGTDALSLLTFAGFNSLRVVDPQPCSPFSIGRQGITLGEGAAFFMLEDEESAIARGTRIYGAISGYAVAAEAFHMTAPEPDGHNAARVMLNALSSAGLSAGDVGWVNAHGTGTPMNDVVESKAARLVFGENVMNCSPCPRPRG